MIALPRALLTFVATLAFTVWGQVPSVSSLSLVRTVGNSNGREGNDAKPTLQVLFCAFLLVSPQVVFFTYEIYSATKIQTENDEIV